ncbi:ABC transporter [Pseudomonas flavescens]|uniref:ABC transporter n=1 Tax=Phytopseudomonas flavescens TaxID=29435 RepID=A0A1G7Z157_9GAMM|nr:ABC transporter ATP-binding protein [Pseudomonas flavescens]SDH01880.1 ABC transporter [Pseudomonas flavescens]
MSAALTLQAVGLTYQTRRGEIQALADVSMSIADGEFVAVLGPSGCGKSTVLKLAAGLLDASQGRVVVAGQAIEGPGRHTGVVFQKPNLLPWKTVLNNVLLPARTLGSVDVSRTTAPEPVLPRGKARAEKFSGLNEPARNAASRQNGPGPAGCAGNLAMRCWRTWQGNNHYLRPPPSLARFLAATRLALKRQQTLGLPIDEARQRATALLELVGLGPFANDYPFELSGGMQQRVGIARMLLHDPQLLLMDEPFAALDALSREALTLELQHIWSQQRKSVLFITHSIQEAVFLADRVLVMSPRPGRIIDEVAITLPRPRTLETLADPAFIALCQHLRRHFTHA